MKRYGKVWKKIPENCNADLANVDVCDAGYYPAFATSLAFHQILHLKFKV